MKSFNFLSSLILSAVFLVPRAYAADGVWIGTGASGGWSDALSWSGGTLAEGAGFTAYFTSDITGTTTVSLDVDRTVGSLVFSDNGSRGSAWMLTGNTLDLQGTAPTITTLTDVTIASGMSGSFIKDGAGTLTVTGPGSFGTGGIVINAGTLNLNQSGLVFNNPGGWGGGAPITVNSGATLKVSGDWNIGQTRLVTIDGGTLSMAVNDKCYVNNLTLMNGATVTGSTIRVGGGSSATIRAQGSSASIINSGLKGYSGNPLQFIVDDVTGSSAADLVVRGAITQYQSFAITKSGSGTLVFSGANTYSGGTTVSGGTLVTANAGALGTGSVRVGSGATLQIGDGAVNGVTLGSGASLVVDGTLTLGAADSTIGLAGGGFDFTNGILDLGGVFDGVPGLTEYQFITGTLGGTTLGTTNVIGFDRNVYGSVVLGNDGRLVFSPSPAIPEPSTYGLLGAGAIAAAAWARRRRR